MFKWVLLLVIFAATIRTAHAGETVTDAIEEAERVYKAAELKLAQAMQSDLESEVVQMRGELGEAATACEEAAVKYAKSYEEKWQAEEKIRALPAESLDLESFKSFKALLEGTVKEKEREVRASLEEAIRAGQSRSIAREKLALARVELEKFQARWGELLNDSRVSGMLGLGVPPGYSPPAQRSSWNPDRVKVKLPEEFQECGLAGKEIEVTK